MRQHVGLHLDQNSQNEKKTFFAQDLCARQSGISDSLGQIKQDLLRPVSALAFAGLVILSRVTEGN